jgi:hypothetical protein
VARVLRRHFRATRRLQSFVAMINFEVVTLLRFAAVFLDVIPGIWYTTICSLFFPRLVSLLLVFCCVSFFVLCGVFAELAVFHVFLLFGLGRPKNYFLIGFLSIRSQ